ncbi:unnamed protein product [Lota lota]
MQQFRCIAGQSFIVFFIYSFHNVKSQVVTGSPTSASPITNAATTVDPTSVVAGSPTPASPTTSATTVVNPTSENTMKMRSLHSGSLKMVNRSGSCIKKDDVYHVYCTISEEPKSPNQALVYDLLQAH